MLPIAGLQDSVTVERDKQEAAADRQSTFGTVLTREQLEALSDDPDILRQQLQDMAGPGAVIKVDSFEGAALPPKAMIRSIRISRDQFAAENHSAGGTSVEIITQPGLGPIRYNTGFRFRGGSLSGRSPFTPTRGPEQTEELLHEPERHARAAEGVVQLQRRRAQLVRDAEHQRVHRHAAPAIGSAAPPHAARQHARERQRRLRRDAQSDAALRLLRQPQHRGQPRHRRVRLRGARLLHRELEPQRPHAAHGAARAAACSRARGCR